MLVRTGVLFFVWAILEVLAFCLCPFPLLSIQEALSAGGQQENVLELWALGRAVSSS